jgi:hypothetical protein
MGVNGNALLKRVISGARQGERELRVEGGVAPAFIEATSGEENVDWDETSSSFNKSS